MQREAYLLTVGVSGGCRKSGSVWVGRYNGGRNGSSNACGRTPGLASGLAHLNTSRAEVNQGEGPRRTLRAVIWIGSGLDVAMS